VRCRAGKQGPKKEATTLQLEAHLVKTNIWQEKQAVK
jgi:hypothetical protein